LLLRGARSRPTTTASGWSAFDIRLSPSVPSGGIVKWFEPSETHRIATMCGGSWVSLTLNPFYALDLRVTRHPSMVQLQHRNLHRIENAPVVVPENLIRADSCHEVESAHHSR